MTYKLSGGDESLEPERKILELIGKNEEKMSSNYDEYKDDMLAYVKDHNPVSNITSIMFPATIEYIGKFSFGFCDSLERVEIYGTDNEKISSVGCYYTPFFANAKLKSFNFFLASERGYGNDYYFEYCTSLEDVFLSPTGEGYVDLNWLESSENINSIHIADGATSISGVSSNYGEYDTYDPVLTYGDYSNIIFEKNVSEIYLPSSLTDISNHTFCTHISTELSKLRSSEIEAMECPDHASVIMIPPGWSYAERYANDNGISCVNSKEEITKK